MRGLDRNSPNPISANGARELQIFCPLSNQPPSVLVAGRTGSDARSLPRFLLRSQACAADLFAAAGISAGFGPADACRVRNNVGASIEVPLGAGRPGAPAPKYSSHTPPVQRSASTPAVLFGQVITDRPASKQHAVPKYDAAQSLPQCRTTSSGSTLV